MAKAPDEVLRALVRKIQALEVDRSLVCDEMRWADLLDSDEYARAKRQVDDIKGES